jgi:hypothetical protein
VIILKPREGLKNPHAIFDQRFQRLNIVEVSASISTFDIEGTNFLHMLCAHIQFRSQFLKKSYKLSTDLKSSPLIMYHQDSLPKQ